MSTCEFPVRLGNHNWCNCFGYLIATDSEEILQCLTQPSNWNSLGFFVINRNTPPHKIAIELFEQPDLPSPGLNVYHTLLLNPTFADLCGLSDDEAAVVSRVNDVPRGCFIELTTRRLADWALMDSVSAEVGNVFLTQIHLVSDGMRFPIWLGQNIVCSFAVASVSPATSSGICYVDSRTEVYVSLNTTNDSRFLHRQQNDDKVSKPLSSSKPTSLLVVPQIIHLAAPGAGIVPHLIQKMSNVSQSFHYRLLPKSALSDVSHLLKHPTIMVVYDKESLRPLPSFRVVFVKQMGASSSSSFFALLLSVPGKCPSHQSLSDVLKNYQNHCAVSSSMFCYECNQYKWFRCKTLPKSMLIMLRNVDVVPSNDKMCPDPDEMVGVIEAHLRSSCNYYPVVMKSDGIRMVIDVKEGEAISFVMKPSSSEMHSLSHVDRLCFIFACDHLPKIHVIKANHDGSRPKICEENHSCLSNFGEDVETSAILQCQEKLVNACAKYLSYCLFNNGGSLRNALVIGKNFSGKSTLIRRLSKKMFRSSIVYSSYIEGLKWKGRSADNVLKALQLEIGRLVKRYPSVLFIDDIDFFEEVEDKSDTNVERIFAGLKRIAEENNIQVVATAKNVHAIHKSSLTSNPKRFFGRTFTIEELNLEERTETLTTFLSNVSSLANVQMPDDGSLLELAHSVEGFTVGLLKKLAHTITTETAAQGCVQISKEIVKSSIKNIWPTIKLKTKHGDDDGDNIWKNVGGMQKVKQLLLEVFVWPSMYPEIYRSYQASLGKAVILSGPSGCGKTLIATALLCSRYFNVISVKGPELLSKYVGQSEKNVRDLFEKAKSSRPCLIFFDEFDSLAPSRGHDSTGVTDRVVNQLLTEMDGVESLEGVFILAATSRIDLIDNALLRPGRFDFIVACELPSLNDRRAILDLLLRDIGIESGTDLSFLLEKMDGWTGCDIRGLVTNATFKARRRKESMMNHDPNETIRVSKMDFVDAFEESLPKQKRSSFKKMQAGQRITFA